MPRWRNWLAPAGICAGGIALIVAWLAWTAAVRQPFGALQGVLLARNNANLLAQHLAMDRGEPLADTVALGAMASLVEGNATSSAQSHR